MRSRSLGALSAATLLCLVPALAWGVTTNVRIQSPEGEPVESGYVVLDETGRTVAEGRTDEAGEDETDLRPGTYVFRSGEGEGRVEIREGQRSASVSITRSLVGLRRWGFDVGLTYAYFDQDGTVESEIQGFTNQESSELQLDGTLGSLYGRVRFPVEVLGGQPFVQAEGDLDPFSDAEDTGGVSGTIGVTEVSSVRVEYDGSVGLAAGLEWETPPLHGDRGLRIRPHAGVRLGWWESTLVNDRSAFGMGFESEDDDFTTTTGQLGLDLGVPLCGCRGVQLDFVLGGRFGFPLGDDEEELETRSGAGTDVLGEVDLDESWGLRAGLELRFNPKLRY